MDISVIIPVYNVEKYLSKCIDSVIAQNGVNLEIILVDDGSTDGCGAICDAYAKEDARIKVIHKQNEGLGYARNEGIDIARGKYFCFVDSDDWLVEGALRTLFELAEKNEVDLIWFEAKSVNNQEYRLEKQPEKKQEILNNEELMKRYLQGRPATVWLKFYRRELFQNIRFSNVPIHEDVYSMHLILKEVKKALITNQFYYVQYVREGSLIQTKFSEKNLVSIECGRRIVEFTKEYYPQYENLAIELLINRQIGVLEKMMASKCYEEYSKVFDSIVEEIAKTIQQANISGQVYKKADWLVRHPYLYRHRTARSIAFKRIKQKVKKICAKSN